MRQTTYSLEGHAITIYGGGTAYTVRHAGSSFSVQGDDALTFEADLEAATESTGPYGAREFLADMMEAHGQPDCVE